ncbi:MAG TPA: terminase TerL endonuclease subunit, partial [Asticcacaulis sp.]|nr:terminase TerL endonuclease subunit [Asticcacaulis sp.]
SVRLLEEVILEKRIRLKRNPVLVSAMMSAVTEEDRWGNHWLSKSLAVNKIDAAVALAMALGAATGAGKNEDADMDEYYAYLASFGKKA